MSKQSFSVTDWEPQWYPRKAEGNPEDSYHVEGLESAIYNAAEDLLAAEDYHRLVHVRDQINGLLDHYHEVKRLERFHERDRS